MIKGLMMTPPVVGRISIGKIVERNGMRLPEKDDEFTITTQVQSRNGWMLHPLDGILRREELERAQIATGLEVTELQEIPPEFADHFKQNGLESLQQQQSTSEQANAQELPDSGKSPPPSLRDKLSARARSKRGAADQQVTGLEQRHPGSPGNPDNAAKPVSRANISPKLRRIPVRLLFNDPALNVRANYTLFDRATARPLCVGDGQSCKRVTQTGVKQLPCSGPDLCSLAQEGGCKPFGRFHMRIDHAGNTADALSTFVLRTTGINTLRTLVARMQYLQAVSGGLLAYLPLEIRLRGKSTAQSRRTPIYYVDLGVREPLSLEAAINQAVLAAEQAKRSGCDQEGLEQAAREGYALGLFEELEGEAVEIVQEFYPPSDPQAHSVCNGIPTGHKGQRDSVVREPFHD
jgi:hypothetical protein